MNLPSTAKMRHASLLIITSQLYLYKLSSSSTFYFLHCYIKKPKKQASDSEDKSRYTETITQLSNRMISFKHGVNGFDISCHLIRADTCRKTQFINWAEKLQVLLAHADNSY